MEKPQFNELKILETFQARIEIPQHKEVLLSHLCIAFEMHK